VLFSLPLSFVPVALTLNAYEPPADGLVMPFSTIVSGLFFEIEIGELKVTLLAERPVNVMLQLLAPLVTVPPVAALALLPEGNVTVMAVDVEKPQLLVFGMPVVIV
jgi:hypothetical protein